MRTPQSSAQFSAEFNSGFCPPKTFSEFYERYPSVIRNRLLLKWNVAKGEIGDWEHDICVHLMTLPERSIFHKKGCTDRISTYDPTRRGGGSEVLFISYVHLLVDNFCCNILGRRNRRLKSTVCFSDLAGILFGDETADLEEVIGKLSDSFKGGFDPIDQIFWKELADRGTRFDSILSAAIGALRTYATQREAAMHLGIPEHALAGLIGHVKTLAHGKQPRMHRRRSWGNYRRKGSILRSDLTSPLGWPSQDRIN